MYIAKNNDLIVLARTTRIELEQDLKYIVYTSIEETAEDYILYNGNYLTTAEILPLEKEKKYQEALDGAKSFIENEACYQFDENNSIEATDGNIGKLTAYALGFSTGAMQEIQWTSKEDNVLMLDLDDLNRILIGIGAIQSFVWNVQYIQYKQAIETATTAEEVEAIEIVYTDIIPNEQQD